MKNSVFIFLLILLLFCSCKKEQHPLFRLLAPNESGINFINNLSENDSLNIINYVYYYNGGGVGIADFNKDGLEDIFFTSNETSCSLYINKGHMKFENVTIEVGLQTSDWCTGVSLADVNGDGWTDIYICKAGHRNPLLRKNLLFINNGKSGKLSFTEAAEAYGIADTSYSSQAAFFDFDHDGDLDLYVMNHANERKTLNTPLPQKVHGEGSSSDHFYINNGNNKFTDASYRLGILHEGYGLGIAIGDVNDDGWEDIYIANDFIYSDCLYINEKGKYFSNQIATYFDHQSYNSMGCDLADFNNDTRKDLITVDMLPETDFAQKTMAGSMTWDKWQVLLNMKYEPQYMRNTLQLAGISPTKRFSEIGQLAGISATDWSWSPTFADLDNDGWKDLFITTGYLRNITDKDYIDYSNNLIMFKNQADADKEMVKNIKNQKGRKVGNRLFQNNRDLTFSNQSAGWGLTQNTFSNGSAYADLDNDGDLDLVISNINEVASVYENKANELIKNNYINIQLKGNTNNTLGVGASIKIWFQGQTQTIEQFPVRGFLSSVSPTLHFGLGVHSTIDSLEIRWPNDNTQHLYNTKANQLLVLEQTNAQPSKPFVNSISPKLLTEVTNQLSIPYLHKEASFNDFLRQPLILHRFSNNGPPIATGDLNGDGLEDFYIGGTKDQPGQVYFQNNNGAFYYKEVSEGKEAEETGVSIFDANNDGKNDIYIVSGSCEWMDTSDFYSSRLYINIGNENFTLSQGAIPKMSKPGKCIASSDFDRDGDMDVFIGGDVSLSSYPLASRSYLLRNDHGKFVDITSQLNSALLKPGIVNAVKWQDLDNNGWPDLILAGEWMPIMVFKNQKGQLNDVTFDMALSKTNGWWNAIEVMDVDNDGDMDLIAGNFGLNTKLRASESSPLSIYIDDFDHNGSTDAITCRSIDGKDMPIYQKK